METAGEKDKSVTEIRQNRRMSGVEHILKYLKRRHLENGGFWYAMEEDGGNVIWVDPSFRLNYSYFGDTLVFDTTYRRGKSRYQVPFAAFTGLNHHGQPLLFGCALILNESQSSFAWLFHTWLHAMSAPPPSSITVEPDPLIQVAVSHVFTHTRLRFSLPLLFTDTHDKLSHVFHSHPTFESDFINCITHSQTPAEFESSWHSILSRYYLEDNDWLHSIYNARQQWVPVFIRDTFFGDLSANQPSSLLNSFFQGFVDTSTTMQMLINQYEKAITSWREKELKADYESTNSTPILKTPSPMEKQAATLYTRALFLKFQEEFVDTLANPAIRISDSGTHTTYRVTKFAQVHKAHTVDFDSLELKANCSCQMFEYSGVVCRHILAVFRATNVLTLPSHYLLRRWTKEAKTRGTEELPEFSNPCQESLTVCYANLRQEATKYVEEGAKSIQSYKAAMDALDEASKKVAAASNKIRGATPGTTLANMEEAQETANAMNHPEGEKERTILELTAELEKTGQRCQVYRANLLSILRDMEDQKFQLSLKVQNVRLSLKD